jgi:hypothetical protein
MPHLREEADADRIENYVTVTDTRTGQNQYEMFCGSCGKIMFVDKETNERFKRAIEHDLDNQLICEACEREQDEASYAAH